MTQVAEAPSTTVDKVIKKTRTFCIPCSKIIPGTLIEKTGDVYMRKECPVHGTEELLYWKDAELYHTFKSVNNDNEQYQSNFDFNDMLVNGHDRFTTTPQISSSRKSKQNDGQPDATGDDEDNLPFLAARCGLG